MVELFLLSYGKMGKYYHLIPFRRIRSKTHFTMKCTFIDYYQVVFQSITNLSKFLTIEKYELL